MFIVLRENKRSMELAQSGPNHGVRAIHGAEVDVAMSGDVRHITLLVREPRDRGKEADACENASQKYRGNMPRGMLMRSRNSDPESQIQPGVEQDRAHAGHSLESVGAHRAGASNGMAQTDAAESIEGSTGEKPDRPSAASPYGWYGLA